MDDRELHRYAVIGIRARLDALDAERTQLLSTLARIEGTARTPPAGTATPAGRGKRPVSPEARQRMADAQKRRWAAVRRIQTVAPVADAVEQPAKPEPVKPEPVKSAKRAATKQAAKKQAPKKRAVKKPTTRESRTASTPPMPRLVKARRKQDEPVPF